MRHVQEAEETSLYVVNADGTGGAWWCKDLKYISGTITVGGGASAAAWSADSQSLAVLSQVPRIGHHEVGRRLMCARFRHAAGDRHCEFSEWDCVGERRQGSCVFVDQVSGADAGACVDGAGRGWNG